MNPGDDHPDWCTGRQCGSDEHRSDPTTHTTPGAGSIAITRVRTSTGADRAEIRLTVTLATTEPQARQQLTALHTHLQTLIGPPRTTTA